MLTFLARQLLLAIPVMFGVSVLVFFMVSYIPGQAPEILAMQAGGAIASGEELEQIRERLGLNDPVIVQYGRFLGGALQGDLGRSIRSNRPVTEILAGVMPNTIQLAVAGMLAAIALGGVLGIVAGVYRKSWFDAAAMVTALIGWSMPSFWLGILLLLLFAVQLGWFPITSRGAGLQLVLPALTLGLGSAGLIARLIRTEIVEQLSLDYATSARAKGLSELRVILRHVLKNSLISAVTVAGLQFGRLLGGTVIVENVFARPGLGRVAVDALLARDMPVLQGAVLILAVIFVLVNIAVDIAYGALDPRIRVAGGAG